MLAPTDFLFELDRRTQEVVKVTYRSPDAGGCQLATRNRSTLSSGTSVFNCSCAGYVVIVPHRIRPVVFSSFDTIAHIKHSSVVITHS